jgi:geranylgeranyl pyrophosphate synthase
MLESTADFTAQWALYKDRANQQLQAAFEAHLGDKDEQLAKAMRYSTENGGKRFRAMLVYASGDCFGAKLETLDAAAVALELVHAYSLVHDDLPSMDDDDLRRGKPSCHVQFDEATAILAGDALQTLAFEILAQPDTALQSTQQLEMIKQLAKATGITGMAGGQSLDIISTGKTLDQQALQAIHKRKTGALIRAALIIGALAVTETDPEELNIIDAYGRDIGLAFQVVDDILDLTQSSEQLGKQSGADVAMHKNTYPALLGLDAAHQYATQLTQTAQQSLGKLKRNTAFLQQLADFTLSRKY